MRSQVKPALNHHVLKIAQATAPLPESGIVLVDMSLNPLAADAGAAAILNCQEHGPGEDNFCLPHEVSDAIRSQRPNDHSFPVTHFQVGRQRYRSQAYLILSDYQGLGPAMIAVHVVEDVNGRDPITDIAAQYRLTAREREALRGIALGLSTKELASRMDISPNTVKAFVRLIMIKLGVTTRTAIIVKLLDILEGK